MPVPMVSYGVTLLSGGLDSTTVAALARSQTGHLTALTFHYGQAHSKEVECAAEIAGMMGIPMELLDISFFGRVAWYSALTNPERFPIPGGRTTEQMGASIPITYVPLRKHFLPGPGRFLPGKPGPVFDRTRRAGPRWAQGEYLHGPQRD